MPSLDRLRKTLFQTHPISKSFHILKIRSGIMKFFSIHIAHGICDKMDMDVIPILMNGDKSLMLREPFLRKFLSEIQSLRGCDIFIFMKRNYIMIIHSTKIFIP